MKLVRFILEPFLLFHISIDPYYLIFLNLKIETEVIMFLIFASEKIKFMKLYEYKQSFKLRSNKIFLNFKKFNHGVINYIEGANANKIVSRIKLILSPVFEQNLVAEVFIERKLYWTLFRPATLLKKRLWHRCFPLNFVKFLRTPFLQNTSGRLVLFIRTPSK